MKLYTLGTSHGATEKGRECSGNLLEINGCYYLFDCGGNVEGKMTNLNLKISDIKAVFVTHMHEDHIGSLSAIAKRFTVYINDASALQIFLPESDGICAFKNWLNALHLPNCTDKLIFSQVKDGTVYSDDNITVNAIPTKHIQNGKFPSFAYSVYCGNKKFLYTGDLAYDFGDYPEILLKEKFNTVLCELVHFDPEKNTEKIKNTKTDNLIFTHYGNAALAKIGTLKKSCNFNMLIAEDGMCFEI